MEANGRNRNSPSPSSERFISLFSRSQSETVNNGVSVLSSSEVDDDLDLDEDEVFWTGDFSQSNQQRFDPPPSSSSSSTRVNRNINQQGILAALPEDEKKGIKGGDRKFVYRKTAAVSSPSPSSSRMMIRTIPRPQSPSKRDYSLSLPSGKLHQSAPVNVPMLSRAARERERRPTVLEVDDEDEEMLPPHEIVARGSSNRSPKTTFSVLEGVGRTLKGRDLRQVRNAVWRQTAMEFSLLMRFKCNMFLESRAKKESTTATTSCYSCRIKKEVLAFVGFALYVNKTEDFIVLERGSISLSIETKMYNLSRARDLVKTKKKAVVRCFSECYIGKV